MLLKFSDYSEKEMNTHPSLFKNVSKLSSVILMICSITFSHKIYSQPDKAFNKAQLVVEQVFKNRSPQSYLLLSKEDKEYLIIEKNENKYEEYVVLVDESNNVTKIDSNKNNFNIVLDRAFDSNIYHKEYIDWNATYATIRNAFSGGKPVYFYYRSKDGKVYGETNLTTIVHPNPIDVSVFGYLLNKLSESTN
jgi:hypothetical protein